MKPIFFLVACSLVFHSFHLFIPHFNGYEWRQWDTFAVIRNFTQEGMQFFSPKTNQLYGFTANSDSRLFLLDFPLYSYIVSLVSFVSGVSFETARGVNIVIATIIGISIYLLLKQHNYTTSTSLFGALLFQIAPIIQFSATSVQPDMLMLAFLMGATYVLVASQKKYGIVGLACLCIATLIKPYAYIIVLPILIHSYIQTKNRQLVFYAVLPPILYVLWFALHPSQSESQTYWMNRQIWSLSYPNTWHYDLLVIAKRTLIKLGTQIIPLPFTILTLLYLIVYRNLTIIRYCILYSIGFFIYFFIFLPGNFIHAYYQTPLIAIVAIIISVGTQHSAQRILKRKGNKKYIPVLFFSIILLCSVCSLPAYISMYDELFTQHKMYLALKSWPFTQQIIPKGKTTMLYQRESSPVLLNMMNRNGWIDNYYPLDCEKEITRLRTIRPDVILIFKLYHEHPNDMKIQDDTALKSCLTKNLSLETTYQSPYILVYTLH